MEEVIGADRVIVMDKGHVVLEGTAREVFSQVELLKEHRLDVPQVTLLAYELRKKGYPIPEGILTTEELLTALSECKKADAETQVLANKAKKALSNAGEPLLQVDHINYIYSPGNAFEKHALKDISLDIFEGEFIGIIGHTGSGKSTLIKLLLRELTSTTGTVYVLGKNLPWEPSIELMQKPLRGEFTL